jgi:hypothetical protein
VINRRAGAEPAGAGADAIAAPERRRRSGDEFLVLTVPGPQGLRTKDERVGKTIMGAVMSVDGLIADDDAHRR